MNLNHSQTTNGNQRTRPNVISNRTSDLLVSPISTDEMANFLGLSLPLSVADGVLLDGLLVASCQYYIDYTNNELLTRTYSLRFDRFPERQSGFSGLGAMGSNQDWWVTIPVWPVSIINSVTVDGEILTDGDDYSYDLNSKPSRLSLEQTLAPNIVIDYDAGYATAADIPPNALSGIQLLTAYLFDHRGACDVSNAAKESGAVVLWKSNVMILTL